MPFCPQWLLVNTIIQGYLHIPMQGKNLAPDTMWGFHSTYQISSDFHTRVYLSEYDILTCDLSINNDTLTTKIFIDGLHLVSFNFE